MLNFKQLFLLSVLTYFLAAVFSKGYHHFDEHFQIIEMANYKMGNVPYAEMPWELHSKMRPTLQPIIALLTMKLSYFFGWESPFLMATLLRLLSAALALYVYLQLFLLFKVHFQNNKKLGQAFMWVSFLLWYLIYNGVRFSSENWSALLIALAYVKYFKVQQKTVTTHLIVGLLFGLAFSLRFQTAFMTMGLMAWMLFMNKEKIGHLLTQLGGIVVGIGLGILADSWFYEEFTLSFWNYLDQNIIQNKVNNFVIRPWTFYFERFFSQGVPPISLVSILSILGFVALKWKSPISWMLLPFFAIHFLIGHKELRFLFSIIPFLPFIIASFIEETQRRWQLLDKVWIRKLLAFTFYVNLVFALVTCFRSADPYISFYEGVYRLSTVDSKLYYIKNNPYHRITNLYFYKPEDLKIEEYTNDRVEFGENNFLVIKGKTNLPDELKQAKLVYTSFPSWLYYFNYNGWIEKSGSVKLYRLN